MYVACFWTDATQTVLNSVSDTTSYGSVANYVTAIQGLGAWTSSSPAGSNFAYALAFDPAWLPYSGPSFTEATGPATGFNNVSDLNVSLQNLLMGS